MGVLEILLLGIGLAMDAFAVSICKGLSMKKMNWKNAIIIALYFGGFQALMPMIGYFLGTTFESLVTIFDHWIAFVLLSVIGGNMIKESFDKEEEKKNDNVEEILNNLFSNPDKMQEMKIRARLISKKTSTKDICKILLG